MISMSLRKILTYVGVWSLIFIGFYIAFWRPRIQRLTKLQNQMVLQQTAIDQLKRDIATYPQTITAENLKKVEESLQQLFANIPTKEEISEILQKIQAYGTQNNRRLNITGLTYVAHEQGKETPGEAQGDSIAKATYRIQIGGSARDILEFLYDLESGARLITIEDFSLRRSSGEDTHSVNADATINIFYSGLEATRAPGVGTPNTYRRTDINTASPTQSR